MGGRSPGVSGAAGAGSAAPFRPAYPFGFTGSGSSNKVRRTLFDDDPTPALKPNGYAGLNGAADPAPTAPLTPGERPPIDPDAT